MINVNKTPEIPDLPSSFDIKKYDACSEFTLGDWYNNLMHRALRRTMLEKHGDYYMEELHLTVERLFDNPIAPPRKLVEGDGYAKNVFRSQVKDQTAFELLNGDWILRDGLDAGVAYRDAAAVMHEEMYGQSKNDEAAQKAYETLEVPAWKMLIDLGVDLSGEVSVNVDLFASEEKLVDDFKAWLKVTRASLGVPDLVNRFDRSDFVRWTQHRILAYLDVTLWAKVKGHRLTNQLIGITLFPNEYNVSLAERIRKTVAPEALAASSTPYMEAMLSQYLSESEQN